VNRNQLFIQSAQELASQLKRGEFSVRELLDAHIERIEQVNPAINAVVARNYEAARLQADKAQREVREATSPFFGVPCSIKDTYPVADLKWVGGSAGRRELVADSDSDLVKIYRQMGLIITCKTNVPEAGMWSETYNSVFGRTNNPFNRNRTAGGSSGGEAALIGAGGVPLGLGSDVGGSIRMPSSFCGVSGHKSTGGLITESHHWPPITGAMRNICTFGPMARFVSDVKLMVQRLAGQHWPSGQTVHPEKLRYYYYDSGGAPDTSQALKQEMKRVAATLRSNGATVEKIEPPHLREAARIWQTIIGASNENDFSAVLGNGEPISFIAEGLKKMVGLSTHIFPNLVQAVMFSRKVSPDRLRQAQNLLDEMHKFFAPLLDGQAVVVAPTYSTLAPLHRVPILLPHGFSYSGIYNVMQYPATSVPCGLTSAGLPFGVQIVGARGQDNLTLAAGEWLQGLGSGFTAANP
jgi:fatty acid amide hydrolase 2